MRNVPLTFDYSTYSQSKGKISWPFQNIRTLHNKGTARLPLIHYYIVHIPEGNPTTALLDDNTLSCRMYPTHKVAIFQEFSHPR